MGGIFETNSRETGPTPWKAFGIWAGWVALFFFSLYPLCNRITSSRSGVFEFFHPLELRIPFVPTAIWFYLLLYVLFVVIPFTLDPHRITVLGRRLVWAIIFGAALFLVFPVRLGFERSVPNSPLYGPIFKCLFSLDRPHNLVPSLHVTFCALILWSFGDRWKFRGAKVFVNIVLAMISLSTLLVHQHHLVDVAAGLGLGGILQSCWRKGEPRD